MDRVKTSGVSKISRFFTLKTDYAGLRGHRFLWIVKFVPLMPLIFLNCGRTCDLTDDTASIYDRKTAARHFDTIHDILRALSLAQSLLKGRNAPVSRSGNRGVNLSSIPDIEICPNTSPRKLCLKILQSRPKVLENSWKLPPMDSDWLKRDGAAKFLQLCRVIIGYSIFRLTAVNRRRSIYWIVSWFHFPRLIGSF